MVAWPMTRRPLARWRGRAGDTVAGFLALAITWTGLAVPAFAGTPSTEGGEPAYTNRLIDSNSPYLLLHAHNPVDWYPWGPEAFAAAKRENKPIFLSVGYSTCCWCHVAERTIYANADIAALMNQWFISVKVDSEQRPDLDQIYMLATHLLVGRGGWPNNVFMTPDMKPFYAGSYFPPADDPVRGQPGFPTILRAIHKAWTEDPDRVHGAADQVFAAMQSVQDQTTGVPQEPLRPSAWRQQALAELLPQFDTVHGGLGSPGGTKFPQSPVLDLLLEAYRDSGDKEILDALTGALDGMALGGVRDHLAGGFHRYSTEATWSLPHFEKMLFDNAQLLRLYAEAYRDTGRELYRDVALSLADYLSGSMMAEEGGFYTALDSQIDGVEGVTYLWTENQVAEVVGSTGAARFFRTYALTPMSQPAAAHGGNPMDHEGGVLRVGRFELDQGARDETLARELAGLAPLRQRLLAARASRVQPARDDKIIVALNGMAIRAFAVSGKILGKPAYTGYARRAAERIWRLAYDRQSGSLKHEIFRGTAQTGGFLADYAQLGSGFLALHRVTGEAIWLNRARALGATLLSRFGKPDGSLATGPNERDLPISPVDTEDNTVPSGTSAAIALLFGLGATTDDSDFTVAATQAVHRVSGRIAARPGGWPSAIIAAGQYLTDAPVAEPPVLAQNQGFIENDGTENIEDDGGFRVPDTADFVAASAAVQSTPEGDVVTVTLRIDPGYHLQANPPSMDYLIPTTVAFDNVTPSDIRYPAPVQFRAEFADETLDVYDGITDVVAVFPRGTLEKSLRGRVTAQACDDRICLPPAEIPITVP